MGWHVAFTIPLLDLSLSWRNAVDLDVKERLILVLRLKLGGFNILPY